MKGVIIKKIVLVFLLAGFLDRPVCGQGTILWNESVNGPLGNLAGSATAFGLLPFGTNTVMGAAEAIPADGGWLGNNDYFTFVVPTDARVSIVQLSVDRSSWAWIGNQSFSTEYGFVINPSNGNLLNQWGLAYLSSGSYGMYMSDYDLQAFPTGLNYRLDFIVQSVPEPGTLSLVLVGLGLVGWRGGKRFR